MKSVMIRTIAKMCKQYIGEEQLVGHHLWRAVTSLEDGSGIRMVNAGERVIDIESATLSSICIKDIDNTRILGRWSHGYISTIKKSMPLDQEYRVEVDVNIVSNLKLICVYIFTLTKNRRLLYKTSFIHECGYD